MNTTISLIRIAMLVALGLLGVLLIFAEEQDESTLAFILHVLFDKSLGLLCIFAFGYLYKNWSKTDKWLSRYEAWNAKSLEE